MGRQVESGHVVGSWQAIVHQRAGAELAALRVINRVFVEGLADALNQPTVHLALDNHKGDRMGGLVSARPAAHTVAIRMKVVLCAHMGHIDEARTWLTRLLLVQPGLTIAKYTRLVRYFPPEIQAVYVEGF